MVKHMRQNCIDVTVLAENFQFHCLLLVTERDFSCYSPSILIFFAEKVLSCTVLSVHDSRQES